MHKQWINLKGAKQVTLFTSSFQLHIRTEILLWFLRLLFGVALHLHLRK